MLASLLQDLRFAYRLFSSRELARALPARLQARFLPVTLPPAAVEAVPGCSGEKSDRPTLTLFCSPAEYRRKNIFNSLLAVSQLDSRPRLLLNGLSSAPGYAELLESLALQFEDPGQMSEEIYHSAIASADLGLQLSFADSFNQVAAQHLLAGVPVLGSPMLPVLEVLSPELRQQLILAQVDSPSLLAQRLKSLLQDRQALGVLGQRARTCLLAAQCDWVEEARNLLRELL